MLEILTKSSTRKKLLLIFFYNQSKEFYLRELAKLVDASSGTTQRELRKLMSNDLILYSKRGPLVFFKLNTRNSLLPYLEGIVKNTIGIEVVLKEALIKEKKIQFAFIFGSYVKNGFKSDSDIDLYIIGGILEEKLHEIIGTVEKTIHRTINYHLSSLEEFKENLKKSFFHKEITQKYILLTDNENEFGKIVK